jgi:cell shape-determining protein MreD
MSAKLKNELTTNFSKNLYLFSFIIFLILYAIYDFNFYETDGAHLIPLHILALIAGVIFESKRITKTWTTAVLISIISFIFTFSLGLYLYHISPNSKFDFTQILNLSILAWPIAFFILYVISSRIFNERRIVPQLTEGITLILSVSMIYWVIDNGLVRFDNIILKTFIIIVISLSLFSFYNAFSKVFLSDTKKLILSIWSSIIMMFFAIDNLYGIFENGNVVSTNELIQGTYIAIQYFLLGISSIYMIQNFMMLIGFLPSWKMFFFIKYSDTISELKNEHIDRYSDTQVSKSDSVFCILFVSIIFFFNYHYEIVPRQFIIWLTFVTFPFLLIAYNHFLKKKK